MMPDPSAASACETTPGPAGSGAAPHWRPLHDQPALSPGTLPLALLAHEHAARACALSAALGSPDPAGYATRLLRPGPDPHGPQLHGPHLDALSAPHPPAVARALREALGDPGPLQTEACQTESWHSGPAARLRPGAALRLPRLLWQATRTARPAAPAPTGSPADRLRHALSALAGAAAHPAPFCAPLSTDLLSRVTRFWLNDPNTLHLELLRGTAPTGASPAADAPDHALNQLRTTLSGPRRAAALLILRFARRQHRALAGHHAALTAARRAALRAAVRAAAALRERGALSRTAEARWLTPHELIAALDGTLPRTDLQALIHARRAAAPAAHGAPATDPSRATAATTGTLNAAPLAPGVRDGRLRHWTPGTPVPPGVVLRLVSPPWPHQLAALGAAAALLAPRSTLHSPVAAHARGAGQVAVCLPDTGPDWLEDGALVRVNGHTGQLTLLRRAGVPDPVPSFDLNLEHPAATPVRPRSPQGFVPVPAAAPPGPAPFSFDLA